MIQWAEFSPKALDFLANSDARVNILHGSVRSSKTINCTVRWLDYLLNGPQGDLAMLGKTTATLQRNVLNDLFDIVGPKNYKWINRQQGELQIFGRRIYCFGANNEDEIANNTKEWKEEEIRANAGIALQNSEKAIWEAKEAKLEFDFQNETYQTRVEQEQKKTAKLAADVALSRQTKQLTYHQTKLLHNQIEKMWWDAAMKWQEFVLDASKVELSWNEFDKDWEKFCASMGLEYDKMEYDARKTVFQGVTDIIKTGAAAAIFKGAKSKGKK